MDSYPERLQRHHHPHQLRSHRCTHFSRDGRHVGSPSGVSQEEETVKIDVRCLKLGQGTRDLAG